MADTPLGFISREPRLPDVPANASSQQIAIQVNRITRTLNTWNGSIVLSDVVSVFNDGSARSYTTVPHNLGYAPIPQAYLNGVSIDPIPSTTLNIPLPTYLSVDTNGIVPGAVVFPIYLDCMTDETNVYFNVYNATGINLGFFNVTYYLMRLNAQT